MVAVIINGIFRLIFFSKQGGLHPGHLSSSLQVYTYRDKQPCIKDLGLILLNPSLVCVKLGVRSQCRLLLW